MRCCVAPCLAPDRRIPRPARQVTACPGLCGLDEFDEWPTRRPQLHPAAPAMPTRWTLPIAASRSTSPRCAPTRQAPSTSPGPRLRHARAAHDRPRYDRASAPLGTRRRRLPRGLSVRTIEGYIAAGLLSPVRLPAL